MDISKKAADNIRRLVVSSVQRAKSGHPGGSMGAADYIHILFSEFLEFNPDDSNWDLRDRFFLDPGHMSMMLYSVLALVGTYTIDDLKNFRQWGAHTPGHPERDLKRGIENTSGPLGLGHVFGVGSAIVEKFLEARFGLWIRHNIYSLISDGGIQEEISQSAGRIAGHLGLGNFIMFYDSNDIQLSSSTSDVSSEDVGAKYRAWGWHVLEINGHDHDAIRIALKESIAEKSRPSLIIGKTKIAYGAIDGKGYSLEGEVSTHGAPLGDEATRKTIENLNGDPKNPFVIDEDVKSFYEKRKNELRSLVKIKECARRGWEKEKPELADKYKGFMEGKISEIDFSCIEQDNCVATRDASGKILSVLADKIENLIVCSADLSNSDKTEGFLKKTTIFKKGDFSGAFLQVGVSELTMAALMVGMSAHGGVIPVGGTFFVFSDYMKPAIRVAGLMGLQAIFVLTHDSFRVGEDGPTHQPIEHEAQIRLLEQMINEKGEMACLVLRPADSAETNIAWKIALENKNSPTVLILSRQAIKDLPGDSGKSRIEIAKEAEAGGYIVSGGLVKPDLILLANGSEVSLCEDVAARLRLNSKLKVRVVSIISEGIFRSQSEAYYQKVLPSDVPIFGVTAGLPRNLETLVGPFGEVYGLSRFGASAPYRVLDEKFGYTPENIEKLALDYYSRWEQKVVSFIKKITQR